MMSRTCIGTKIVSAIPVNRVNAIGLGYRVDPKSDEDEGYEVTYEEGYKSWSPKSVFDKAYRDMRASMTFGDAIMMLKRGVRVARSGWNGKGMWLQLVEPYSNMKITDEQVAGVTNATLLPYIAMKTADNKFVPWLASQTDMLSEDWVLVE